MLFNTRSLVNKTTLVSEHVLDQSADIALFTETWIKDNDLNSCSIENLKPEGYKFKSQPRSSGRGGGIGILYKPSVIVKVRKPRVTVSTFQLLESEIISDKTVLSIISAVYRPPPSKKNRFTVGQFLEEFEQYIATMAMLQYPIIIAGDFNLHVDGASKPDVAKFLSLLSVYGFNQRVTGSTHKYGHTLDLILSRSLDTIISSVTVEDSCISDHSTILCELSIDKPKWPLVCKTSMNLRSVNSLTFSTTWASQLMHIGHWNANHLVEQYNLTGSYILDSVAPLKKRTLKLRPGTSKWYNNDIHSARQLRRKLEHQWQRTKLVVHKQPFLDQRSKVVNLIKCAKFEYYKSKMCNMKQTFNVINRELLNRNATSLPSGEHEFIAESFSKFFSDKVQHIREQLDANNCVPLFDNATKPNLCGPLQFDHTNVLEFFKIISTMPD
ncbi:uncharacterized protein LOC141906233 [Tubulanus polymorphus]|uniref:uncharacterized protein LOC141906233 n=1 Tax=Tubulanus polymorphus TaxID=672921 RepID=UPI003DA57098